jgi:hypothetical protein
MIVVTQSPIISLDLIAVIILVEEQNILSRDGAIIAGVCLVDWIY